MGRPRGRGCDEDANGTLRAAKKKQGHPRSHANDGNLTDGSEPAGAETDGNSETGRQEASTR